jgi:hypothetical protein
MPFPSSEGSGIFLYITHNCIHIKRIKVNTSKLANSSNPLKIRNYVASTKKCRVRVFKIF